MTDPTATPPIDPIADFQRTLSEFFDFAIARLIVGNGTPADGGFRPGLPDDGEGGFVAAVLTDPTDDTARKVYADWLDEHGRHAQAAYLRVVRRSKFVRRVRERGGWALFQSIGPMPPRPPWNWETAPMSHARRASGALSPRVRPWLTRIRRGWRVPKWLSDRGYSSLVKYFGVADWEYFDYIRPALDGNHAW
jgi:uncharacterized protein (TIGR02996 family)